MALLGVAINLPLAYDARPDSLAWSSSLDLSVGRWNTTKVMGD